MFYIINYENGEMINGEFNSYSEALDYAEKHSDDDFCIEEYECEYDYHNNI